ncbi:MAG TPA: D-aminoacyl-tRNA deacylase [Candidatus Krumholzibacteria bacterium]|nr:D-aminoacyl-tRNA deacylase [Candidatus Krumholzibacteria bacterium]
MRVVVQRVARASVAVESRDVGSITRGFLVLAAFASTDGEETLRWMARKVASLRIFSDESERMTLALDAVDGRVLVVPQFTLYGDVRKGARPSFEQSAAPDDARALYERFVALLREELPGRVETGEFQASMQVSLVNDGPVTIVIDRE